MGAGGGPTASSLSRRGDSACPRPRSPGRTRILRPSAFVAGARHMNGLRRLRAWAEAGFSGASPARAALPLAAGPGEG